MPKASASQSPPDTELRRSPRFSPNAPRRSPRLAADPRTARRTAVASPQSARRPTAPTVVTTRTRAPARTPVVHVTPNRNSSPTVAAAPRRARPFPMALPQALGVAQPSQQVAAPTPTRTYVGAAQPSQQVAAPTPTRTYASRSRTYLSESLSSISTIVSTSTSPDRLPTVLEILQELRGARGTVAQPAQPPPPVEAHASISAASRSPLAKMVRIVKDAGICGICKDYMRTPYITSCGHACCPGCLRDWFESKLKANLRPYLAVNHYPLHHSPLACQTIPKSFVQLEQLKNALLEHGCFLRPIFRYPCPMCRTPCLRAPTQDFALQEVLTEALAALGTLLDVSIAEEGRNTPSSPFVGLFLL